MKTTRMSWHRAVGTTCMCVVLTGCTRPERPAPAGDSARPDNTSSALSTDTAVRVGGVAGIDTATSANTGRPTTPGATASRQDTARGIVRRVGADPLSRLVLLPASGAIAAPLALAGAQQAELAAAEGLEVMVTGARTTERAMEAAPGGAAVFQVRHFVVRAADGVEARDGVLVEVAGRYFLESAAGTRMPLVDLPSALRTQVGARVFLVGPATRAPQAFGVLRGRH